MNRTPPAPARAPAFALLALLPFTLSCGEEDTTAEEMGTAIIPSGLEQQWKLLPHRFSHLELRLLSEPYRLATRNDGGPFGAVDRAAGGLWHRTVKSPGLKVTHGQVKLEIQPGMHSATKGVAVPLEADSSAAVAVVLRGLLLSTNDYPTPPAWKSSYDPANGFTSAGLGVRLKNPIRQVGRYSFDVQVTNRLSPCDRDDASKQDDMNGVIPRASSWITVEYSVVEVPGGSATAGSSFQDISYPDFGALAAPVKVPSLAARTITLQGKPGLASALVGLAGFEFESNTSSTTGAACTDKRKTGTKGPGRYIRTVRARGLMTSYDRKTGEARAELDLMFANKAAAGMGGVETGSMCVKATGDLVLVQLPSGATMDTVKKTGATDLKSGERGVVGVTP